MHRGWNGWRRYCPRTTTSRTQDARRRRRPPHIPRPKCPTTSTRHRRSRHGWGVIPPLRSRSWSSRPRASGAQSVGHEYPGGYTVDDEAAYTWTVFIFITLVIGTAVKIAEINMGVGAAESEPVDSICGSVTIWLFILFHYYIFPLPCTFLDTSVTQTALSWFVHILKRRKI
jgi:hypothetical protein